MGLLKDRVQMFIPSETSDLLVGVLPRGIKEGVEDSLLPRNDGTTSLTTTRFWVPIIVVSARSRAHFLGSRIAKGQATQQDRRDINDYEKLAQALEAEKRRLDREAGKPAR